MTWRPFQNIGLKLTALGVGIGLWITVSGQQVERHVLVQLQFRNVPASLELAGDTPRTADVRVRGAAGLISPLEPYQVVATIDLTDARPGVRVFPLTVDHVSVPLGVQVLSVDPSAVSLTLEKSGFAQVPVKPTIDGDPAPGFEVSETICEPKTVEVTGPESHLRDRPTAITERISIEGAQAPIIETVNMAVSDPALRLREVRTARVTVRIVPGPVARFPDQQIQFKNLPAGRQVDATPPLVSVTLRGKPNALSGLKDKSLDPYVDVAGLGAGRYNLPVRVSTRDDIVVTAIEPSTVTVRIR